MSNWEAKAECLKEVNPTVLCNQSRTIVLITAYKIYISCANAPHTIFKPSWSPRFEIDIAKITHNETQGCTICNV
jgi:putative component of membrane protein insertase Oxa1/YidC/SpoIIIJ protein YidD